MNNQVLLLQKRPDESFPQNMNFFQIQQQSTPQLEKGEILIRVLFIGIDPVMRVWLSGAKTYIDSVQIGQVMPAFGVGQCIESKAKNWNQGQLVFGVLECAQYCVRKVNKLFKVPSFVEIGDPIIPLTLSIYGVTGLTALNAMKQIPEQNRPIKEKNKTLCVSSAAGSTGSVVCQIAKKMGYRVVGIVSSQEKVEFLKELGVDECVTYNQCKQNEEINVNELTKLIKSHASQGIDVYYDNAGEEILDAVIPVINKNGYVLLCGATSTYNSWKQRCGLQNLAKAIQNSIKFEGIMFLNEKQKMYDGFAEMVEMVNEGSIKHQEEILLGIEQFIIGLQNVFLGKNKGKTIIQIYDNQLQQAKL
ncbi:unnamed protein product [Paramecium primaurelia]|uniref:Uncharacterized protein n=1 Tax=Paramecium primaurelia TaxID=5886 RepID=A0A8S1MLF6_PARPR|nr:unnamed protein product [Paramecium primaurelia]